MAIALDSQHTPDITLRQRYVRTANVNRVHDPIGNVVDRTDVSSLALPASKIEHMPVATGIGTAGVVLHKGRRTLSPG